MRIPVCTVPFLLLASCFPTKPQGLTSPAEKPAVASPAPIQVIAPAAELLPTILTDREISRIRFEGVSFDARFNRLVVIDQPNGPGSLFPDAESAAKSVGGIACANAGFFTPQGTPLGLVVGGGNPAGSWNSASSLGSGIWYAKFTGEMAISRREQLGKSNAYAMRDLIQAGPLLVENHQPITGLEATKNSARTFMLWDGGFRWWMGRSSPCTLAELASAIANGQPSGWKTRFALNLDGGRSADLWISFRVPGGPVVRRNFLNRPVRNFLAVLPK